ncbi:MAG: choice-of-anchor J domain-containing protein [Bacteroidota bacterium]
MRKLFSTLLFLLCSYSFSLAQLDVSANSVSLSAAAQNGCGSASELITVEIINLGNTTAASILAGFGVDGGAQIVGPEVVGSLPPGDTVSYTFVGTADLSGIGVHDIAVIASVLGDTNSANDTTVASVTTIAPLIPSLPIVDFSAYSGSNLSSLFPGWREGEGMGQPSGTFSDWDAEYFGNDPAHPLGNAIAINLWSTGANDWVVGPTFTASGFTHLQFDLALTAWADTSSSSLGSDDLLQVMISTDCGGTFSPLATYDANSVISNTGQLEDYDLTTYAGQDITIAFFATEGTTDDPEDNFVFLDNININELLPKNVAVVTIQARPSTILGCGLGADSLMIEVKNIGTDSLSGIQTAFAVDGGNYIPAETIPGTIAPNQIVQYAFATTADLSAAGLHTIDVYATVVGDTDNFNDSASTAVTTVAPLVPDLPIVDFAGYQGTNLSSAFPGWSEAEGVAVPTGMFSDWENGSFGNDPNHANGNSILINLWDLGDNDWIVGPKFTVENTTHLQFDLAMTVWSTMNSTTLGSDDVLQVMISTDCGASYLPIGTYDATSTISNTGQAEDYDLSAYAGQDVYIAFYATEGLVDDPADNEIFIDNINILNLAQTDVSPVSFAGLTPVLCGGDSSFLQMVVENLGVSTQTNVPAIAIVEGMGMTDTFMLVSGSMAPGGMDTLMVGPLNTADGGTYMLTAITQLSGDEDLSNDTTELTLHFSRSTPPQAAGVGEICIGDSTTLFAIAEAGLNRPFAWYDAAIGGTLLGTGDSLPTGPLGTSQSYYLGLSETHGQVGLTDNTTGTGGTFAPSSGIGLIFDVMADISLNSVRVYPFSDGDVTINLLDANGMLMLSDTFAIPSGVSDTVLAIGWQIAPASGYQLTAEGSTVSGLFRNDSGASYPYSLMDAVEITGPTNNLDGFYYFFYDWQITSTDPCRTTRTEVPVTVVGNILADFQSSVNELTVSLSDMSMHADSVRYTFGDGGSSTSPNAVYTYADSGTYEICQYVFSDCGRDTICMFVRVDCDFVTADFDFTLLGGTEVSFTSTATNADSVVFDFGNGSSSSDPNPTFDFGTAGDYTVSMVAYNSCSTDTIVVNLKAVGLEQLLDLNSVRLYPNPGKNHVIIEMNILQGGDMHIEIVGVNGQNLIQEQVRAVAGRFQHRIELKEFATGMYLVKLQLEGQLMTRKLQIQ